MDSDYDYDSLGDDNGGSYDDCDSIGDFYGGESDSGDYGDFDGGEVESAGDGSDPNGELQGGDDETAGDPNGYSSAGVEYGDSYAGYGSEYDVREGSDDVQYGSDDVDYDSDSSVYVEFDGCSKGNPGPAGGGAVIRTEDGTVISRACEGLGHATNNEAEYEGLRLGLETALGMGYDRVHVRGDSQLVTNQVQGKWGIRNERMAKHYNDVRRLMDQFRSVDVSHVPRSHNSEADAEANKGVNLRAREVYRGGRH